MKNEFYPGQDPDSGEEVLEQWLMAEHFKTAFFTSPVMMAISRVTDGRFLEVNECWLKTLGFSRKEVIGRTSKELNIANPADWPCRLERLNREGKIHNIEIHFKAKSGESHVGLASMYVLFLCGERCRLSVIMDVTEIHLAEAKLRQKESMYQELFQNRSNGVAVYTARQNGEDFILNDINRAGEQICAVRREDALGKSVQEVFPGAQSFGLLQVLRNVFGTGEPAFWGPKIYRAPRISAWIETWVYKLPSGEVVSVFSDVTRQKTTEAALAENEKKYQELFNKANDAIFLMEHAAGAINIIEVNDAACRVLGYTRVELLSLGIRDITAGDELEKVSGFWRELLVKGNIIFETVQVARDGRRIPVEIGSHLFALNDRQVVLSIARDISQRREAEEDIRWSEERFSKAFRKSPIMMCIRRMADDAYMDVNERWQLVMGYERKEVIGKTARELNVWLVNKGIKAKLINDQEIQDVEIEFRIKSGEIRTGLISTEKIYLNNELCRLCVIKDITEQKRLEENITRLDRFNLIGQMAASIAHEIRNPMTTIRGFLQLLGGKREYIGHKEYFDLMLTELDRANGIIGEFLSLAKDKVIRVKKRNLNDIVKALAEIISADALMADKYLKTELEKIPDLMLDENEIRQLILNLARNGLEAMAQGGCLTVKTFEDLYGNVVLCVKDEGIGIQPNVIEKIGLPFFTTKDKGTGLGLAVCYSIAARHHASIGFETGPQGTVFSVRFKRPETSDASEHSVEGIDQSIPLQGIKQLTLSL